MQGLLYVFFDLGNGATYRGPANVWASADYRGATGAVSVVGTNGATFYVTGVKLEVGNVATPFNRQSLAKSMADCQRYYQQPTNAFIISGYALAGATLYTTSTFQTAMRANPTITPSGPVYSNASGLTINQIDTYWFRSSVVITATGVGNAQFTPTMSAEL